MNNTAYVDQLTPEVCRTLLASHHLGRVAFVGTDGFPVVFPVNNAVRNDDVVISGRQIVRLIVKESAS